MPTTPVISNSYLWNFSLVEYTFFDLADAFIHILN